MYLFQSVMISQEKSHMTIFLKNFFPGTNSEKKYVSSEGSTLAANERLKLKQ